MTSTIRVGTAPVQLVPKKLPTQSAFRITNIGNDPVKLALFSEDGAGLTFENGMPLAAGATFRGNRNEGADYWRGIWAICLVLLAKAIKRFGATELAGAVLGDHNNFDFFAVTEGAAGNDISVAFTAAPNQELAIVVVGSAVDVQLACDGDGVPTSTTDDVKTAWDASAAAALAVANVRFGTNANVLETMDTANLAGGSDASPAVATIEAADYGVAGNKIQVAVGFASGEDPTSISVYKTPTVLPTVLTNNTSDNTLFLIMPNGDSWALAPGVPVDTAAIAASPFGTIVGLPRPCLNDSSLNCWDIPADGNITEATLNETPFGSFSLGEGGAIDFAANDAYAPVSIRVSLSSGTTYEDLKALWDAEVEDAVLTIDEGHGGDVVPTAPAFFLAGGADGNPVAVETPA